MKNQGKKLLRYEEGKEGGREREKGSDNTAHNY